MRVLLVEDDPDFRLVATRALGRAGIELLTAEDGPSALRLLAEDQDAVDCVLLDVVMPGTSGWDLFTRIRGEVEDIPVIFVTGRESLEERVRGLRMGADDYLVKPVEFPELVARIEAVLRRRRELSDLTFGDLRLEQRRRVVTRASQRVALSPREFDLLCALMRGDGKVVARETLLHEVWGLDRDPGTNVLDVHIGRLRRKLDALGPPLIETVRGSGYRLLRHPPAEA